MNPGDVILVSMPRLDGGAAKLRPAVVLARLPGSAGDLLVCGVSTQLRHQEAGWDELVEATDPEFVATGLRESSLVRLSYLSPVAPQQVAGIIGQLSEARAARLRERPANLLLQSI